MHEANITVVSMRMDGRALKAAWDGAEHWMDIPDSLRGHFEWKQTYLIEYTTTKKNNGSIGYAIKQMKPANGSPATPAGGRVMGTGSSAGGPSNGGPEAGMYKKLIAELVMRDMWDDEEILGILDRVETLYKRHKGLREGL